MLVKQCCYDRAIVKKLFFKLKKMSVMVARKKKNSVHEQNADPFQSVVQSLSRSPHQSIHQFNSAIHGQKNVSRFTPILFPARSISCWVPV